MNRRDPNAVDLSQQTLRLADDLIFWPVRERGELVYRIEIPTQHKFFRVGYEEYVFISLLDGKTTIPQACGLAAAKLGRRAPSTQQAETLQRWLLRNKLARLPHDPPPSRDETPVRGLGSVAAKLNPFWMKLPIAKSSSIFQPLLQRLSWVFSPVAFALGMFVLLVGGVTLTANWNEFRAASDSIISPGNWFWLFVSWVALKVVHELAHAVACHRQGGEVSETGIVFVLFAPLAYVDVTSCWRMASRWPRVAVASAGMYIELLIAAVAMIAWVQTDSMQARWMLHNLIFTAGLSTILFNANALMRFDGYFILADLLDMPNLYGDSTKQWRGIATRIVFGKQPAPNRYAGWRLWFLRFYGAAVLMWKVTICLTLAIAASAMFAGAGILIAVIGLLMWCGHPLRQLVQSFRQMALDDRPRMVRGCLVTGGIVMLVFASVFWLPVPTATRVPAAVAFLPEANVRSLTDGFITRVHVRDRMPVKAGDPLVDIENPELNIQVKELQILVAQYEVRSREAIQNQDASARLVIQEKLTSLKDQILQIQARADGLTLVAERDGQVFGRRLENLVGTFVREGDVLMVVAQPSEKELVAVIDQEQIKQVRQTVGEMVSFRSPSYQWRTGHLDRIDPRATNRLHIPAMSAANGGPLAVRESNEREQKADPESIRLLEPHFTARISLDPQTAEKSDAGMLMNASIGYRRDPIATRIATSIRRLWHQANDELNR